MNFEGDGGSNRVRLGILVTSDIFRRGLRDLLQDHAPSSVQSRILTLTTATNEIKAGRLDALILDTGSAPRLASALSKSARQPRVILVSSRFHAGISLPLPKDRICSFHSACSSEEALKQVLAPVLTCRPGALERGDCERCTVRSSLNPRNLPLSQRETQILEMIGRLLANSEISEQLDISVKTVEAHSANIKRKLNLDNSRELMEKAIRWVNGL